MKAEPTDAELVLAARFGEPASRRAAYSSLVLRYEAMVRAMLRGLCGNHATADELAQESFLTAWLELEQLNDVARYGGWLKQIAYRKFLSAMRRNKVEVSYLDSLPPEETSEMWSGDLDRVLRLCKPEERELLLLIYGFGFTVNEVATESGRPAGTIKSMLSRARQRIAEQYEEEVIHG